MCGICGIYRKGHGGISRNIIIAMRDIMTQRGPDDAGVYIGDHIGLGHRRLSIIDLSSAGNQPMSNENNTIWMVFNGEIYNFKSLKEELKKSGHVFKSRTDCEVIIHGYEEWGEALFVKLNGMFAFALWDSTREQLILARDRIGKKPLFYSDINGSVVFASDIKSILAGMDGNQVVDEHAIDCYLSHICIPHAHTIYKNVKKVPPAHYIVFNSNASKMKRYWFLSFTNKIKMNEKEYIDHILELLTVSVKDRLYSDVPIGAFLSGGVDSSLIVALMSQVSGKKINTFSVGFDYQSYNELPYAKKVADRYNTNHHEFILSVDYLDIIPQLVWNYGEPFADSSAIPSYYISRIARTCVKTVLVGDGGDEAFAGYDRTQYPYRTALYKKMVPRFVARSFSPIIDYFSSNTYLFNRIKYYEEYTNDTTKKRYQNYLGCIKERDLLYSENFKKMIADHHPSHVYGDYYDLSDGTDDVDKVLFVDYNTILPDDYQVKMDVASMANSLEVRAPFLDHRLV
ncbi:MAG: asparagine synthase (glutamine-hydrolyzing), partial [Elusimicrobia bacterium]|nr:asparagine synthase (glutamine-hydrolyzing) [Elusimicrobiota bacterium]MBD3412621.1 asparagine synthase (glutamine-hydrolyzing) [Elusimicrobiota bacterium]